LLGISCVFVHYVHEIQVSEFYCFNETADRSVDG